MEKSTIAGYVGRDAEIKDFSGNQYTAFSLAVDKSYKNQEGIKVEKTNWYSVLRKGTGIAPYIKKGTYLIITGEPSSKLYKDKNGNPSISLNLNADQIHFGPSNQTAQSAAPQATTAPETAAVQDDGNDDLPF